VVDRTVEPNREHDIAKASTTLGEAKRDNNYLWPLKFFRISSLRPEAGPSPHADALLQKSHTRPLSLLFRATRFECVPVQRKLQKACRPFGNNNGC